MKKSIYIFSLSFLCLFTWIGCQKQDTEPHSQETYTGNDTIFVSSTSLGTYSKSELKKVADSAGFQSVSFLIQHGVTFHKIIYKTPYKGKMISVSGLLALPENVKGKPALLSAQHGTIFRDADAPSNAVTSGSGFELLAAVGFITILPDYIGYGTSKEITHPYFIKKYAANTVVNMIRAVKYYLKKHEIAHNDRLFLLGYSEGGYTTMAAQEKIETDPSLNLTITAAAEGAGGYDLPVFMSYITKHPDYAFPAFPTFILNGYNITYDWNRPLSDFFQSPYDEDIPDLLDGTKKIEQIDAALPDAISSLFTPAFYADLKDPSKEKVLKEKLTENSFQNWYPKSPTRLYHGTADKRVPFVTSDSTYVEFETAGATNVTFHPIEDGTHLTSIIPMMRDAIPWLLSLNK